MNVKPVLGDWEIPRIAAIESRERRTFVELPVPGRAGGLLQDLESVPTRLAIRGSLYGDEARNEFLESLRGQFQAGEAVTFVADILTATELQYVVVEELSFRQMGSRPDELEYSIILVESPPPPPPPDPVAAIDDELMDQAGEMVDSVTGALDAIEGLGSIPELSDPTPPLKGVTEGVRGATEGLTGLGSALSDLFGDGS